MSFLQLLVLFFTVTLTLVQPSDTRPDSVPALKSKRVINGAIVRPHFWPQFCTLTYVNRNPPGSTHVERKDCGCTILRRRWILTAAHCVYYNGRLVDAQFLVALAGKHNQTGWEPGWEPTVQYSTGERIIVHPDYNSRTNSSDIALVKLRWNWNLTYAVQHIRLPTEPAENSRENNTCVFVGRGATVEGGSQNEFTHQILLTLVPQRTCRNQFRRRLTADMLCAIAEESSGQGPCIADDGGPLYCFRNNRWSQVGVLSYSMTSRCSQTGRPHVFQRVFYHKSWIVGNLPTECVVALKSWSWADPVGTRNGYIRVGSETRLATNQARHHRGIYTMILNGRNCATTDPRRFDTDVFLDASNQLATYLRDLSDGTVIVGVTAYSVVTRISNVAFNALREIGVNLPDRFGNKFAFVAAVGAPQSSVTKTGADGATNVAAEAVVTESYVEELQQLR